MNPKSGNSRALKQWARLQPAVEAVVPEYTMFHTEYGGHATLLAREALEQGYTRIVSCGGDGTHCEVANGFFDNDVPINPEASMVILPFGTGCDLGRSLRLPKPSDTVEYLADPNTIAMDVGKLTCCDENGESKISYFLIAVHIGLGGHTAEQVNRRSKILGGFLTFLVGLLAARLTYRDPEMTLTINGESYTRHYMDIFATNCQYDGGGMHIGPKTLLNNGKMEVYSIDKLGFFGVLSNIPRLYRGTLGNHPKVNYFRAKSMTIKSDSQVWVAPDGEVAGQLPATIDTLPRAIKMVMGPNPPIE